MILINKTYMRMRDSCERLAVCGRGCEVRAVAPVHVLSFALLAFAVVLFFPHYAFADSSVIWGPSSVPNAENGIVVNAPDRFRAAAVALGYGDDAYSEWSDEVRAKLSNASTGGRFYQFAMLFGEFDDALGSGNPITAVVSAIGDSFWAIAETLYGDDIWIAGYSSELAAGAASDLSSILAGDNIGGGGSGDGVYVLTYTDSGVTITWANQKQVINGVDVYPNAINYNGVQMPRNVVDMKLRFTNVSLLEKLSRPNMKVYIFGNAGNYNGPPSLRVLLTDDTAIRTIEKDSSHGQEWYNDVYSVTKHDGYVYYYSSSVSVSGAADSEGVYSVTSDISAMSSSSYTWKIPNGNGSNVLVYTGNAGGNNTPVVPPTNWPDEPAAPSPPELPEPGTDVPVTPTPWTPVISPTFDFDLNITTEPTSNDLIDWVKKIYYELRNFHSDAQDWFDEVGNGIDSVVNAVNGAQRQIYSELQTIDDTLRDEGQKIRDYMYQMFHWLKDQLNFQNDSFNDSNIVYWLKRIWSKLGSGDINLRPTDPTSDPENWWDWLVKAIQNFLIGLAATSTELISEIADLASQVMHEFPFSIPWDIAAVLAALSTAPITPVFTVTVPAISGWWSSFDIVIDMHPFDGAAETIRLMEKLLFTGLLIWKSKELLDFMDVTKWFGG